MVSAFDKLARPVQKWIRAQGWRELRHVQSQAIHSITGDTADLIIAATTASGKTEAAFLPLISQILDDPSQSAGFDLLYIGPLKALSRTRLDALRKSVARLSSRSHLGMVTFQRRSRAGQ